MEGRWLKIAWKNTGNVPVAGVKADIRFWNQDGDKLWCSPDDYFVFAAENPRDFVMPGKTHYPPSDEGYVAILLPGESVSRFWAGNLHPLVQSQMPQ